MVKITDNPRQYRNKMEADFASHLGLMQVAGEIKVWWYEEWRWRLGAGAWFCPDFVTVDSTGELVVYETKGFRREAAIVRIKAFASKFGIVTYLVTRKARQWHFDLVDGNK